MTLIIFLLAFVLSIAVPAYKVYRAYDNDTLSLRHLSYLVPPMLVVTIFASYTTVIDQYINWLWFSDVGYLERFTMNLQWEIASFLAIFLTSTFILGLNSWYVVAKYRAKLGDFKALRLMLAIGAFLSLFVASGYSDGWFQLVAALKQVPFGIKDPVFGHDAAFYVFTVPALQEVIGCLRVILTLAIVMGLVVHALIANFAPDYEETTHRGYSTRKKASYVTSLSNGTTHLMVLLALLIFTLLPTELFGMWSRLYSSSLIGNSPVFGVNYIDDHVRNPFTYVVMATTVAAGLALLFFARRPNRTSYIVVIALALSPILVSLAGQVAAKAIHTMVMRGNEFEKEEPYIKRNIEATKTAFGIDQAHLTITKYPAKNSFDQKSLERTGGVIDTVRLWDYEALQTVNMQYQVFGTYYHFPDIDVDRYLLDGNMRQLMLSARELDNAKLHNRAKSWQNLHLVYTHGIGLCANDVSEFTASGSPNYLVKDIPVTSSHKELQLTEPRIYFGTETREHVYVGTKRAEFDYQVGDDPVTNTYTGTAGIKVDSLLRKMAIAFKLDGWALITSDEITSNSRLLMRRDLQTRVQTIAPFLTFDHDPLRVVADGKIMFIWDGYTTTANYPYSERFGAFNYIRNSVKVTMDAYTGQVNFYVFDEHDPIIATYAKIYPGMFKKADQMPASLRQHVRYPEDLIAIQAHVLGNYHMHASSFYGKTDAWDIATQIAEVNAKEGTVMEPQYLVTRLPGESKPEFIAQLLFSPHSTDPKHPRGNLVAQLVGRCDGDNYGKLILAEFPRGDRDPLNGPAQVSARIMQDANISRDITMWNQQGSSVVMRRMVTLPLDDGSVLYVQPIFSQSSAAGSIPELKRVAVVSQNAIGYAPSFKEALAQIVGSTPLAATAAAPSAGAPAAAVKLPASAEARLNEAAGHLKRYFELSGRGKAQEAGLELERTQAILNGR